MSSSAAHAEAARQNGKLSHGPATAAGKARSSQNARKHNLLGSTVLLSCEEQAGFDAIAEGFIQEYCPETPTENRYVREMIDAEFRLQRVRAHAASIQDTRMSKLSETPDMDDAAEAFRQLAEEGPSLSLLLRYENQFRRQFDKSLELLLNFRLRERTDKDKIKKAHADAYVEFMKDLVDLPMPGTPMDVPEPAPPAAPKSNPINSPKEPSNAAPKSQSVPAAPAKKNAAPLFGNLFASLRR
jgi:hypothetical protein